MHKEIYHFNCFFMHNSVVLSSQCCVINTIISITTPSMERHDTGEGTLYRGEWSGE